MKNYYRRIFTVLIAFVLSVTVALAQNQVIKHVVDRGETIEDIASKYGVTTDAIIKQNPEAAQFIYVGMELKITLPSSKPKVTQTPSNVSDTQQTGFTSNTENVSDNQVKNSYTKFSNNNKYYNKWDPAFQIGYGFNGKNSYMLAVSFGANYNFTRNLYLGGRLGYRGSGFDNVLCENHTFFTISNDTHSLYIPLEVGYRIPLASNGKFSIVPFAGIAGSICLKSKSENKVNGNKINMDGKGGEGEVGFEGNVGLRLSFNKINVSFTYLFGLSNKYKDISGKKGIPEVSVGFGF